MNKEYTIKMKFNCMAFSRIIVVFRAIPMWPKTYVSIRIVNIKLHTNTTIKVVFIYHHHMLVFVVALVCILVPDSMAKAINYSGNFGSNIIISRCCYIILYVILIHAQIELLNEFALSWDCVLHWRCMTQSNDLRTPSCVKRSKYMNHHRLFFTSIIYIYI